MDDIVIIRKHGKTLAKARKSAEHMAAELSEEFDLTCAYLCNRIRRQVSGIVISKTMY